MGGFTDRMKRAARERENRDAKSFARTEMCHDCAFRPESPERQDPELWAKILKSAENAQAFRCHIGHDGVEMPVGPDGEYCPKLDSRGQAEFPLCAGWCGMFDKAWKREGGE